MLYVLERSPVMSTWIRARSALPILCAFVMTLLVWGCATDSSPVASDKEVVAEVPQATSFMTFSTQATGPAAKLLSGDQWIREWEADDDRAEVDEMNDWGGWLWVWVRNGLDDIQVKFDVPRNALDRQEHIGMRVHGETLSSLVVEFAPSGLSFNTPATLEIEVDKELVDISLDTIVITHYHADGTTTIEESQVKVRWPGNVEIVVDIPGFSRYSMGRGD
jgi:hypothetical protein